MTQTFNDVSKSTERIFKNGNSQAMSLSKKRFNPLILRLAIQLKYKK
ncbi:hypothetical protein O0M08_01870 [Staphylococcus pseudintermedius]|nr:hypothetical protein [Staphylococcus pseudintermedius]MDE9841208.1 hypothetical protein [Staphylococcus pseudintermedius]MDE9863443.1 hypothetical protein [Staphylococcus pseudintermedius]MDE9916230.1 hypothetical protein [Staphylococcus pseudintermedius]MDE9923422.1 hypothetical protein [Staphylococcus pseudintermedius]MDE9925677.1 hypothetical protein [Staphylococcus pseudintermedius]